ncbi:Pentatricopeptide repeat, partial [Dillenia turbinata]
MTPMIGASIERGETKSAIGLFDSMPERSVVTWNSIIFGLANAGIMELARLSFERMPKKNEISCNSIILGYVKVGDVKAAWSVFDQMPQKTVVSWTAIISGFTKIGDLMTARGICDQMPMKNVISWNAMIAGLAFHGHCKEALAFFDRMCSEGVKPDDVIFIPVLSTCTQEGLLEEGKLIFEQMVHKFELKPRIEHYEFMVDLLAHAGKLEEAMKFIENMHSEPNIVIWATLLYSCKIYGKVELLEFAIKMVLDEEAQDPGYLKLVANLNTSIGCWQDVLNVWAAMQNRNLERYRVDFRLWFVKNGTSGAKVDGFLVMDHRETVDKIEPAVLFVWNETAAKFIPTLCTQGQRLGFVQAVRILCSCSFL